MATFDVAYGLAMVVTAICVVFIIIKFVDWIGGRRG
jgi:hypothetical protein